MKEIIAYCENENCGTIFSSGNAFNMSGNSRVGFHGAKLGPCPNCGSFGTIPDGYYEFVDESIKYIKSQNDSIEKLIQLQELLYNYQKTPQSKENILQEVNKISPEFAEIAKSIPEKFSILEWIKTIIAIITLGILIQQSYFKKSNDDEIKDKFIEILLEQNNELKKETKILKIKKKIGRNDSCHCGSGEKYKKCCLTK